MEYFFSFKKNWASTCSLTHRIFFAAMGCGFVFLLFLTKETQVDLSHTSELPSLLFPLGTDTLGRDLASRFGSCLMTLVQIWLFGIVFGLLSIVCSIPLLCHSSGLFLLLCCQSLVKVVPFFIWVVLGAVFLGAFDFRSIWITSSLFISASCAAMVFECYLTDSQMHYWEAARSLGGAKWRNIVVHGVFSNWTHRLGFHIVDLLQRVAVIEVSLSYLGLGVQEPQASFGNVLSLHFPLFVRGEWWATCIAVLLLIVSLNVPSSLYTMAQTKPGG